MRAITLEPVYTMDEACALVPMCRRKLQEYIKTHPFYYENGSRKIFAESDIAALRAALRRETQDRRLKHDRNLTKRSALSTPRRPPPRTV
jgi:hypothetical protein